jgi:hypothetical protein
MKVFCDLHHADLYYSLQLLFEKRLEYEMYRPIGLEWYEQKLWAVYDHPATAQQYLGLDQAIVKPKDVHGNYLEDRDILNKRYRFEDGIFYIQDPTKNKVQRGITLEKFKDMKFDILVSSIPAHINIFNQLIKLYQPQAKHIFQVGNAWGNQPGVKNILSSTAPFYTSNDINIVFYHQEFDLDIYKYTLPTIHTYVNSYIHYMQEMDLLQLYKNTLSNWLFKTYGAGMEDYTRGSEDMGKRMADSGWTWHVKPGGDGYGHVLHNTYACGRPAIIKKNYYNGKIANNLLEDKITCIDVSSRSVHENVILLRQFSQPDYHIPMCERTYKRFTECVNFDWEFENKIKPFLERLR